MKTRAGICVGTASAALLLCTQASAQYAPPSRPGPALTIGEDALAGSLTCAPGLAHARRSPVLLVAGTGATPHEQYSWNYERALTAAGVQWCAVTVPDHTLGDVQIDGEYFAWAIRHMHAVSGRKVSIVGHSQGGMIPRWTLRFWPDVRRLVEDMISLAADNHGTEAGELVGACAERCPPAAWQNLPGSKLLHALNTPVETFAGISYTQIYTNLDVLSTPAGPAGTSPLHTGDGAVENVGVQDVCPTSVADHVTIGTTDPVAYALVLDALSHPGPAAPGRVDRAVCLQASLPEVDPAGAARAGGGLPYLLAAATPLDLVGVQEVDAEPELRCYVFAACGDEPPVAKATLIGSALTVTLTARPSAQSLGRASVRLPEGVTVRRPMALRADRAGTRRWTARRRVRLGRRTRARLDKGRTVPLIIMNADIEGRSHRQVIRLGRSPLHR